MRWTAWIGHLIAGAVASLALPPLSLVPFLLALSWPALCFARASSHRQAVGIWMAAGAGWFIASTHWTAHSLLVGQAEFWFLVPLAAVGLPLVLALFWAAAAALAWQVGSTPIGRVLWLVPSLALAEYGRGFVATGFPWNAPGYVFSAVDASLQSASLIGLYGLTLVAFGFAVAASLWRLDARRISLFLVLIPVALTGFGVMRLHLADPVEAPSGAVARLVQPHIPQAEKWDFDRRAIHLQQMIALSTASPNKADIVIWPETAFAGLLDANPALLRAISSETVMPDAHLITGLLRFDGTEHYYNAAAMLNHWGQVQATYDKRHLVPFGEYAPLRDYIPFVDVIAGPKDYSSGGPQAYFNSPALGQLQLSICYESIFPGQIIPPDNPTATRPDVIINITNDGWFGTSLGPYQHEAQARMRAVEEGIPLLRVANTGISAGYDAYGRVLGRLGLGAVGAIDISVPPHTMRTPYVTYREFPFMLMVIAAMILAWSLDGRRALRQ